jgi:hypothetical protein
MANLEAPVLSRRSTWADIPALKRLPALRGTTKLREASTFVAEVRNELVAAVPLAGRAPTLHNPELSTPDLVELLQRWARNVRRREAKRAAQRLRTSSASIAAASVAPA